MISSKVPSCHVPITIGAFRLVFGAIRFKYLVAWDHGLREGKILINVRFCFVHVNSTLLREEVQAIRQGPFVRRGRIYGRRKERRDILRGNFQIGNCRSISASRVSTSLLIGMAKLRVGLITRRPIYHNVSVFTLHVKVRTSRAVVKDGPWIAPLVLSRLMSDITQGSFQRIVANGVIHFQVMTTGTLARHRRPRALPTIFMSASCLVMKGENQVVLVERVVPPLLTSCVMTRRSVKRDDGPRVSIRILRGIVDGRVLRLEGPNGIVYETVMLRRAKHNTCPRISHDNPTGNGNIVNSRKVLALALNVVFRLPNPGVRPIRAAKRHARPRVVPIRTGTISVLVGNQVLGELCLSIFQVMVRRTFIFNACPRNTVVAFASFPCAATRVPRVISQVRFLRVDPLVEAVVRSARVEACPRTILLITARQVGNVIQRYVRVVLIKGNWVNGLIVHRVMGVRTKLYTRPRLIIEFRLRDPRVNIRRFPHLTYDLVCLYRPIRQDSVRTIVKSTSLPISGVVLRGLVSFHILRELREDFGIDFHVMGVVHVRNRPAHVPVRPGTNCVKRSQVIRVIRRPPFVQFVTRRPLIFCQCPSVVILIASGRNSRVPSSATIVANLVRDNGKVRCQIMGGSSPVNAGPSVSPTILMRHDCRILSWAKILFLMGARERSIVAIRAILNSRPRGTFPVLRGLVRNILQGAIPSVRHSRVMVGDVLHASQRCHP